MLDFLTYDLKVAVLIIVFYMFYRLLLAKESFHRVNRLVLLLTALASFVLPLCEITIHETVLVQAAPEVSIGDVQMSVEEETPTPLWQTILPVIYIIGMLATLGHTLLSIARVWLLIRRSEQHPEPDGTIVCVTGNDGVAPFSWMRYIVMNRGDYEAHEAAILAHERGHIRLKHSFDVLLVDLLTALQWFNPAMWMLRQDLRDIHEYEADGEVLSQGIDARQYQYLLISKATGIGGYSIANGISHSTLKNRIHMMTNKKTCGSHLLKLLALVPIVGIALALNARTVTDYVYDEPQKLQPVKKGKKTSTIKTPNQNIEVVTMENAPEGQTDGQTFKIRGIVKDKEKGEPIVGAIVRIADSKLGTVTDMNGEFTLDVKKGDAIVADYIGYASHAITVKGENDNYAFVLRKDDSSCDGKAHDIVEQMPQFPGGTTAMMQYLSENIRYPEEAHKNNIQGRVIVTFVVRKDGSISDAKIMRSVHPLLDAEALRVVYAMPKWNPGIQNDEPVNVKYTVPITFRLKGEDKPASEEAKSNLENKRKDYVVVIDGKEVDVAALSGLSPDNIESMKVEKAVDSQQKDRIIVTLKKKKQ